jgi:hypothetical protein
VSWSSPGGGTFDVSVIADDQPAQGWLSGQPQGSAVFNGQTGHSYWFLVTVRSPLGLTAAGMSDTLAL